MSNVATCPSPRRIAGAFVERHDDCADHLSRCASCLTRWRWLEKVAAELATHVSTEARDCPDENVWAAMADGGQPSPAVVEHLCRCGDCSALWKFLTA